MSASASRAQRHRQKSKKVIMAAGTAMRCYGHKGGARISSQITPGDKKVFTIGALIQANHGQKADLRIANVPLGEFLVREEKKKACEEVPASTPTSAEVGKDRKAGTSLPHRCPPPPSPTPTSSPAHRHGHNTDSI
ncbi:hypothetical protein IFR05_009593 [Cadophora sp. M221]|nr:hypothetical protein IFR05_009593 [Cadophora sp. M221]